MATTQITRKNSFDFIRLFAAGLVVFSHSFALTGHSEPGFGNLSLGALGVWIFFILSGYLISTSWDQYPRFNVFFAKRVLRIFPGLIVAIFATIFATGIFFSTLPFSQFLSHQITLDYLNNIFLFNTVFSLPGGVFSDNLFPNAVNGSIWTLAYEFTMYIAVALIGISGFYKWMRPIRLWLILFFCVLLMILVGQSHFAKMVFYLDLSQLPVFALMFFSGVVMHKEGRHIKLDTKWGILSLLAFCLLAFFFTSFQPLIASVFLTYALFALGRNGVMSRMNEFGDFSYGLYIYAFPIQQCIAAVTHTGNPYRMFIMSIFISLVAAALSWYLVESKALKLKGRINMKKYPLLQADEAW